MKIDSGSLAQAKDFSYRLLDYRQRTEKEIENRLAKKGFEKGVIAKTITDLKALGLLDDYKFAKAFARVRIKHKPSGVAFIRSKLYSRGIAAETINSIISDIRKEYDEYSAAHEIATRRAKRFSKINREKAKRRIYGYLLRRRFKKDIIYEVLNRIFKD